MRATLFERASVTDYLHNPFQNRFNDPVTQRHDDIQAYDNMLWLADRNEELAERNQESQVNANLSSSAMVTGRQTKQSPAAASSDGDTGLFAGLFSLLLILLVSVVLLVRGL